MKKVRIILAFAIAFLLAGTANAQQLFTYNLNMQNPYLYNPAYTLDHSCYSAFANSHIQWMGFDGAPQVNTFGLHGPVAKNMGLGISVATLKHGLMNNFIGNLSYSYRGTIAENHYFALGFTAGALNDKMDYGSIENADVTDPQLVSEFYNTTSFNAGFGLAYHVKGFEAQIAIPQLLERKATNMYTIGILSYDYQVTDMIKLKPAVMMRGVKISPYQYEGNISAEYNKMVWIQGGYRSDKSIIMGAGVNFSGIKLGYAYQMDNGIMGTVANGTHEIQLIYDFADQICNRQPKTAMVSGTIKNSVTGKPIEDAEVIITDAAGVEVERKKTDENGRYKANLKLGESFTVAASATDYAPKSEMLTMPTEPTDTALDISLKPTVVTLKGTVSPTVSKIKVYDSTGKLIFDGAPDASGNYSVKVEPGKQYRVEASADSYESANVNVTIGDNIVEQVQDIALVPIKELAATIKNRDTDELLTATVVLKDASGKVLDNKTVTGLYKYSLKPGSYTIEVTGESIISVKETIVITNDTKKEYLIDIKAKVMNKNKTFALGSVNFETGKSIIKPESYPVLDELVKIMKENPEFIIEIQGHTDNVGAASSNTKLSQARAEACVKYATERGIAADKLTAKGFGPSQPLVPNTSAENKAKNRRVEFKVVN